MTDDAGDDAEPDPSVCTSTKACDFSSDICLQVTTNESSDTCYSRWECFAHFFDDEALKHPCSPQDPIAPPASLATPPPTAGPASPAPLTARVSETC